MISRTSISSGLSFLVGSFRPTSHGGRAVASASVRSLEGTGGPDDRSASGAVGNNDTSVDGRITSSEYFLINKVDARSVAGLSVSAAWDE